MQHTVKSPSCLQIDNTGITFGQAMILCQNLWVQDSCFFDRHSTGIRPALACHATGPRPAFDRPSGSKFCGSLWTHRPTRIEVRQNGLCQKNKLAPTLESECRYRARTKHINFVQWTICGKGAVFLKSVLSPVIVEKTPLLASREIFRKVPF